MFDTWWEREENEKIAKLDVNGIDGVKAFLDDASVIK